MSNMYTYNVEKYADTKVFENTCKKILAEAENSTLGKMFVDVDGTQYQLINTPGGEITVVNDYEVDAVYVDSEVNLDKILN